MENCNESSSWDLSQVVGTIKVSLVLLRGKKSESPLLSKADLRYKIISQSFWDFQS